MTISFDTFATKTKFGINRRTIKYSIH